MALAYCILAHRAPRQVGRLLRALDHPGNFQALHYDRRASHAEREEIASLARERLACEIVPSRHVRWGRFSQIRTQLELLRVALRSSDSWTHAFFISGQDFPLRSQKEMVDELDRRPQESFVSWFDPIKEKAWPNAETRLRRMHIDSEVVEMILRCPGLGRRLRALFGWQNVFPTVPGITRQPPRFFHWYGGSNHPILSRAAAEYLVSSPAACRILQWLRSSGHPDETAVQSVLLNGPLADRVVNDDRRAIYWEPGAASPRTLTMQDLPLLQEARAAGKLFARKLDISKDEKIIDFLEAHFLS